MNTEIMNNDLLRIVSELHMTEIHFTLYILDGSRMLNNLNLLFFL